MNTTTLRRDTWFCLNNNGSEFDRSRRWRSLKSRNTIESQLIFSFHFIIGITIFYRWPCPSLQCNNINRNFFTHIWKETSWNASIIVVVIEANLHRMIECFLNRFPSLWSIWFQVYRFISLLTTLVINGSFSPRPYLFFWRVSFLSSLGLIESVKFFLR